MTGDLQQDNACCEATERVQELPKESDKVSKWPQISPDPDLIEQPWDVPGRYYSMEIPLCNNACPDTFTEPQRCVPVAITLEH